jgi:hypothetical protein
MKRTKFDRSHVYKTTFDSGKLIPVFVDEVLPGDTTRMSVNYFARLATPIKPVMDNIYLDWFFFFVPNRLVWEHWQNFCFEQEDPDDTTDYVIPTVSATGNSENAYIGSLWDYFGLPVNTSGNLSGISALPFRGVYLIWNEWFRDENLQKSVKIQKGDANEVLNSTRSSDQPSWVFSSGTSIVPGLACPPRGKRHDYFTSALPWTQKGPGVSIGLAGTASIVDPTPGSGYLLHSSSNQLAAVSEITNKIKRKIFRILFNKHFIIVNYTFKSSQSEHIVVINLRRAKLFCLIIINGIKSQYLNLLSLKQSKIYES